MKFSLFMISFLFASAVHSGDTERAEIFVANNYHLKGKPCEGGNIVSIESVVRATSSRNIKDQINLKYFPAGSYSFKFRFSMLQKEDGACSEKSDEAQVIEINREIRPWKHYEVGLSSNLAIYMKELDERPISMNDASGLGVLTKNRSIWISSCIDLFPENKTKYINWFKASSFSQYADVFGFTVIEGNFLSRERVETILESSSKEVKILCDLENIAAIKNFDYLYGPYVQDVKAFMEKTLGTKNDRVRDNEIATLKPGRKTLTGSGPRTQEEISSTITNNKNHIFNIYNRKLRRDPNFSGIYHFRFSINEWGAVKDCRITNKGWQDTEFAKKVCSKISTFDFGYKKNSGTRTYEYPINFK